MRPKSLILIIIALGCGLVASIGISQVMENRRGTQPAVGETENIFVAKVDVDIGEVLNAELVQYEEWPKDKVPEGAITKLEDLEGRSALTWLYAGEPILQRKLIDQDKAGGAALRIPKGYRIQTVKVDAGSGNANLIQPGDRVDVLVYLRKSSDVPRPATKTILTDVRVFAVNEHIERAVDRDGNVIQAKTVTLAVTPSQGEKLYLASQIGEISLTLRRPDDDDVAAGDTGMSIDDILGKASEDATPDDPVCDTSDQGGFLGFLEKQGVSQPAPPADSTLATAQENAFVMDIVDPEGIRRFEFRGKDGLPHEVGSIGPAIPRTEPKQPKQPLLPGINVPPEQEEDQPVDPDIDEPVEVD